MVRWQRTWITRPAALTALAASTALLAHYLHPDPRFCGFDADCDRVLFSQLGRVFGPLLPIVGMLTFGVLFTLSLFPTLRAQRVWLGLAVAAGVGGLILILVQLLAIGHVCPYCLVADAAGLVIAAVELSPGRATSISVLSRTGRWAWLGAAAVAVVLGFVVSWGTGTERTPVPPQITALWVPGRVTIVEIADFQCPHCRRMHAVLTEFLRVQGDRVHFARLTAPMPGHPQARGASRAFLCAEREGRGDAVAEALFTTPDLSPQACERLATSAGVSVGEFRACVGDPGIDERLDGDVAWVQAASPRGLPVVWVQDRMLFGEQSYGDLRDAVTEAEEHLQSAAP